MAIGDGWWVILVASHWCHGGGLGLGTRRGSACMGKSKTCHSIKYLDSLDFLGFFTNKFF